MALCRNIRLGCDCHGVEASAWTPGNTGTANAVAPTRTYTIDVADEASCLAEAGLTPGGNGNPSTYSYRS